MLKSWMDLVKTDLFLKIRKTIPVCLLLYFLKQKFSIYREKTHSFSG